MVEVVSVANQKGGTGKTTTAVNLAAVFAESGLRTLLVDFDPQGSATSMAGFVPAKLKPAMYEVVMEGVPISEALKRPQWARGELDLAPSNLDLAAAEALLITKIGRERALFRALKPVADRYDIVLIDTPPSLGILTINALMSSNHVLIPVSAEYLPLEGIPLLLRTLDLLKREADHEVEILGYVVTMVDRGLRLGRDVREALKSQLGELVFKTEIPRNVKVAEAPRYGKPVVVFDPDAPGAVAYRKLAQEILDRLGVS